MYEGIRKRIIVGGFRLGRRFVGFLLHLGGTKHIKDSLNGIINHREEKDSQDECEVGVC